MIWYVIIIYDYLVLLYMLVIHHDLFCWHFLITGDVDFRSTDIAGLGEKASNIVRYLVHRMLASGWM